MIEREDLQQIWGIFSAFDKSIPLNDIMKYDMPYSDGNISIWTNPTSIQHPLAEIEIVAWDSCMTLIISKDDEIINKFNKYFNYSIDFEQYKIINKLK